MFDPVLDLLGYDLMHSSLRLCGVQNRKHKTFHHFYKNTCAHKMRLKPKTEAHHHLIIFEGSFVVKAELSDDNAGALPQVVLPHSHVLLPSGDKHTNKKTNKMFSILRSFTLDIISLCVRNLTCNFRLYLSLALT